MKLEITRRVTATGQHEAIAVLRWYAGAGSFLVEAVGLASDKETAEINARLMLGQARASLIETTTEGVA